MSFIFNAQSNTKVITVRTGKRKAQRPLMRNKHHIVEINVSDIIIPSLCIFMDRYVHFVTKRKQVSLIAVIL